MHTRSPFAFRRAVAALVLVCSLGITSAFAVDKHSTPASPPATAGQVDAASAQPAPAWVPGPEHRRLGELAGRWTVRQSMWADPAKPPVIDHGAATFTVVLGGRHLRQDLRIDSKGRPFEGIGYVGYDNATGKYDSLWMDVNFTGTIIAHGDYAPASRTYTFLGAVPDPAQGGAVSPLREVMQIQDADHFTYEYHERHGGREMLAVRLEYARVK